MDNKAEINVINTNARSLRPKIKSFIQCFMSLSLSFAVITETWLAQGSRLESDSENLLLGHGLAVHHLNRTPGANGLAHGGVAVIVKDSISKVNTYPFPNPENFEILPLGLKITTIRRKFHVIAVYIPPNYTVARGKACLLHLKDLVLDIKRKVRDSYILIAGDFNQWDVGDALLDYPDLLEVPSPPTRGDRKIDKIFTNWHDDIHQSGCLPPLETDAPLEIRTTSDHKIQYLCSRIEKREPIRWENYTYRPFHERGAIGFENDLRNTDWQQVYNAGDSNDMAIKFQQVLDDLMHAHFPLRTIKRKESDLPWFDYRARKMVKKKNAIYMSEGKSDRWEKQGEYLENHLQKRREIYLQKQRDKFLDAPNADVNFFKNVRAFKNPEKPKQFDVRSLRPGNSDAQTAAEAAEYFNRISSEFSPLQPEQIPTTYHRDLPMLSPAQVQQMLIKAKKPASMVEGDIFPKLINRCSESLAWPLSAIYNQITLTYVWPLHWKREYVTIIPKKTIPSDFSDLRNISCTLLFSKIFEKQVLKCLKEEVELKQNQYGGVQGCSTTHMIIDILQEICENSEDYRSATVLCAIDYAKAFNRMSFQHCLLAFQKHNASTPILRLLASFLTNRTMTVRVGNSWSEPLPVNGGCPQGSILGVILFNMTTNCLEDGLDAFERRRLNLPEPPQPQQEEDNPQQNEPPLATNSNPRRPRRPPRSGR